MTLEYLQENQLIQVTELFHQAYAEDERLGIHFKAATISVDEVKKHHQTQPMFVTNINETVVSTASLRLPWSLNPSPFALPHLGWVATHPDYQKRSLSKALITAIINDYAVKVLKAPALTLGTAKEHPWLIRAYEKLGFVYLGEKQLFSDHKTVYMIKVLDKEALAFVKDNRLQTLLKERHYEF
ncbi:GNAT family N-acetyltransferase [Streptococcus dentiloxodontae]